MVESQNLIGKYLNQNVIVETTTGKTIAGKFCAYNAYEIQIEEASGEKVVFWKHALVSIRSLKKETATK